MGLLFFSYQVSNLYSEHRVLYACVAPVVICFEVLLCRHRLSSGHGYPDLRCRTAGQRAHHDTMASWGISPPRRRGMAERPAQSAHRQGKLNWHPLPVAQQHRRRMGGGGPLGNGPGHPYRIREPIRPAAIGKIDGGFHGLGNRTGIRGVALLGVEPMFTPEKGSLIEQPAAGIFWKLR